MWVTYPSQIFQSIKIALMFAKLHWLIVPGVESASRRCNMTAFSSAVKNVLSLGHGQMRNILAAATTQVIRPSMMKIHLQPSYPPTPSILVNKNARKPLKAPARIDEQKKNEYRSWNS